MLPAECEIESGACDLDVLSYESAIAHVARTLKLACVEDLVEPLSKSVVSELSTRLRISLEVDPCALERVPGAVKRVVLRQLAVR